MRLITDGNLHLIFHVEKILSSYILSMNETYFSNQIKFHIVYFTNIMQHVRYDMINDTVYSGMFYGICSARRHAEVEKTIDCWVSGHQDVASFQIDGRTMGHVI